MDMIFPGAEWETRPPGELGFDADKLARVQRWLREVAGDRPFQVGIARYGYLTAEWRQGVAADSIALTGVCSKVVLFDASGYYSGRGETIFAG